VATTSGLDRAKDVHILRDAGVDNIKKHKWNQYKVSDKYAGELMRRAGYLFKSTNFGLVFFGLCSFHEWAQGMRS